MNLKYPPAIKFAFYISVFAVLWGIGFAWIARLYLSNSVPQTDSSFHLGTGRKIVHEIENGYLRAESGPGTFGLVQIPESDTYDRSYLGVYATEPKDGNLIVFFPVDGCGLSRYGYIYSRKPLRGKTVKSSCGSSAPLDLSLTRQVAPHWWYTESGCS